MLVPSAFHGWTMLSAKLNRAWVLLPLAALAVGAGCGPVARPQTSGQAEAIAPRTLQPDPNRRPLHPAATATPADSATVSIAALQQQVAGDRGPRILDLSATPSADSPDMIRQPAAASGYENAAAEPAASRYPEMDRDDDISHAPPDSIPQLAERPRYEAVKPENEPEPGPELAPPAAPADAALQPDTTNDLLERHFPPLRGAMEPQIESPAKPAESLGDEAARRGSPDAAPPWRGSSDPAELMTAGLPVATRLDRVCSPNSAAMQSVSERSSEISNHAFSLAQRGMFYAARGELIESLRLVAQALDVQTDGGEHSNALSAGLTAMREAQDFAGGAGSTSDVVKVAEIAAAHRTPVLQGAAANVSPVIAQQQYLAYAQSQLIAAAGQQPVASHTLYRLGRVQMGLAGEDSNASSLAGPQAMVFQQAALGVDHRNYLAANELGVLLARYGQWPDARRLLLHSVTLHPHAEGWHNLAIVHRRLGEEGLARLAEHERQLASQRKASSDESDATIRWVDTKTFAAAGPDAVAGPEPAAAARSRSAIRGSISAGATR